MQEAEQDKYFIILTMIENYQTFSILESISLFIVSTIFSATNLFSTPLLNGHVEAQLISEVKSIQPGHPFWVAIRLKMGKDWHTYWRNPGDSGLPTTIEWEMPDGLEAGEIQWPYPQQFGAPPVVSYGYKDEVLLLVKIDVAGFFESDKVVKLSAKVDWLECKDICLPGHQKLKIELPVKDEAPEVDNRWAEKFEETRKSLPVADSAWKVNAKHQGSQIIIYLTPPVWFNSKMSNVLFFSEQPGVIDHSAEQKIEKNKKGFIITLKRSTFSVNLPARLKGVLFSRVGWRGPGTARAMRFDVPLEKESTLSNN